MLDSFIIRGVECVRKAWMEMLRKYVKYPDGCLDEDCLEPDEGLEGCVLDGV